MLRVSAALPEDMDRISVRNVSFSATRRFAASLSARAASLAARASAALSKARNSSSTVTTDLTPLGTRTRPKEINKGSIFISYAG
jgi:hypothetical protein